MARLGQFRRDTMDNWKKENPIIADGEFILIASDSTNPHSYDYWACGDGTTEFINLKFKAVKDGTGVQGITDELTDLSGLAISSKGVKKVVEDLEKQITDAEDSGTQLVNKLREDMNAADERLEQLIDIEADNRNDAVSHLDQSIQKEAQAREDGDATNKQYIDDLTEDMNAADRDLGDRITEVEKIAFPLSVFISLDKTLLEFTGETESVYVTWQVQRKNKTVTPSAISLRQDDTSLDIQKVGYGVYNANIAKLGETLFSFSVTAEELSGSASAKLNITCPMYFGFLPIYSVSDLTITNLSKQGIKLSPNGTYTLNNPSTGGYMWLCVPNHTNNNMTINKVVLNGFDVPMEAAASNSVTISDIVIPYKCYRSSNALVVGTYTFVIS